MPILYRDEECIDIACEIVWLALECKNVEYVTVLVPSSSSKTGDANDHNNNAVGVVVPRIVWPDDDTFDDNIDSSSKNKIINDPIKLLEQIQLHYPTHPPNFYPRVSSAVDASRCNILRLSGVMPRNTNIKYMNSAPYIFKTNNNNNNGPITLVARSSHAMTLEEIEELLEEYDNGPYMCGKDISAADIVWLPYLERYAVQLPLIYPTYNNCHPKSSTYDGVREWFIAMENIVPAYACRVRGDARHWQHQLLYAMQDLKFNDNTLVIPPPLDTFGWWMEKEYSNKAEELWKEYSGTRPWLADTPSKEVCIYLLRNCDDIVSKAVVFMDITNETADKALREIIQHLLHWKIGTVEEDIILSDKALQIAQFVSEKLLEVPRDLGMIPALALVRLVQSALMSTTKANNIHL
jgi:glutathione S-transferase